MKFCSRLFIPLLASRKEVHKTKSKALWLRGKIRNGAGAATSGMVP